MKKESLSEETLEKVSAGCINLLDPFVGIQPLVDHQPLVEPIPLARLAGISDPLPELGMPSSNANVIPETPLLQTEHCNLSSKPVAAFPNQSNDPKKKRFHPGN